MSTQMDSRAREIVRIGDAMFADRRSIDSLWQEIAYNFYPERANFTVERDAGEEFADHLFSSYPVMARRELGNMLAEFLRPDKFFGIHVDEEELDEGDHERKYLERLTTIQWRAMSDPAAALVKACGQTDHDLAAFGNGVIKFGTNVNGDALLFRNYHLRDCAWSENAEGTVDCLHRNWKPTARQLQHHFPKTISKEVQRACGSDGDNGKDPEKEFDCRHVVVPARFYDYKSKTGKKHPFVSLYVECQSQVVLEEVPLDYFCYVVPRWQTVSGSAYGTSMTTAVLLPDGRTLQVVMRTLREAGEMHVNPPMVATMEFIRSDIALYPGGITTADAEYDSKIGDVLRPITRDKSGFPIGREIAEALKEDIRQGFMLDKLQLPETTRQMTATEVRRRVAEHIRAAAPVSKPIQREYNHPLCGGVFQLLSANGAFPVDQMPDSLSGKDIKFKFRSPLDQLAEENEAEAFADGLMTVLAPAAQVQPELIEVADLETGVRDSLRAKGWKQKWFKPKEAIAERRAELAEKMQEAELMQKLGAGADIVQRGGKGASEAIKAALAAQGTPDGPVPGNGSMRPNG